MNINIQTIATIISLLGFVVAAYKVIDEQKKHYKLKLDQEKRLEYKLRIYEVLTSEIMTIDRIINKFQDHSPFSPVDAVEIRKCVYEMLIEKNLVTFENGSYTVDTVSMEDDEDD